MSNFKLLSAQMVGGKNIYFIYIFTIFQNTIYKPFLVPYPHP